MFLIVLLLDLPAAIRLVDGGPHGICDRICIHDDMTFRVSGRTPDRLDQGRL